MIFFKLIYILSDTFQTFSAFVFNTIFCLIAYIYTLVEINKLIPKKFFFSVFISFTKSMIIEQNRKYHKKHEVFQGYMPGGPKKDKFQIENELLKEFTCSHWWWWYSHSRLHTTSSGCHLIETGSTNTTYGSLKTRSCKARCTGYRWYNTYE